MVTQLISYQFQKVEWNINLQAAHVRNVKGNMVCKAMLRLHLCGLPMVKYTHDEIQYIQLNINYESPALLAMHQLKRGKLRRTVQWGHKPRKELIQHMRSVRVACCVCVQACGRRSTNVVISSLTNNKPACACVWEGCGGRSHKLFPMWFWLKIPLFDAWHTASWLIMHRFSTAVMLFIGSDTQLSEPKL